MNSSRSTASISRGPKSVPMLAVAITIMLSACTDEGGSAASSTAKDSATVTSQSSPAARQNGTTDAAAVESNSSGSPQSARSAILLIAEADADGSFEARVGGVLAINDKQCFAIGTELLIAPQGSKVSADGKGVTLAGYDAEFRVGEEITVAGGHEDAQVSSLPSEQAACVPAGATAVTLAIVSPGH